MKLTNLKYVLLLTSSMLFGASIIAMQHVPTNHQQQFPAGTVWLSVTNKTNRVFAIFSSDQPIAQIKAGESRTIAQPIPINTKLNKPGYIRLQIKDLRKKFKIVLDLGSVRLTEFPQFTVFLNQSMELGFKLVDRKTNLYNPLKGNDTYFIHLVLDGGDNLEKSSIEVVGMQQ